MTTVLVTPDLDHLPGYVEALARGWSPDNVRGEAAAREQLASIEADLAAFVASRTGPEARGDPVELPDGSRVARLPGFHWWLWDGCGAGAFCGSIGLRWQSGTAALPPHVLGHIGFAVVPWRRSNLETSPRPTSTSVAARPSWPSAPGSSGTPSPTGVCSTTPAPPNLTPR